MSSKFSPTNRTRFLFASAFCVLMVAMMGASTFALAPSRAQAQVAAPSAVVTASSAYGYAGPGRGFWVIVTLGRNTTLPVLGVDAARNFWLVRTARGEVYVSAADVRVTDGEGVPTVDPGLIGSITAGNAAVRVGPGVEAGRVGVLGRGSQFYVLGRSADGGWLAARTRFGKGWIAVVVTDLAADALAPGAGVTPAAPVTAVARVIVNASTLNVRSGPGAQYTAVGSVVGGAEYPIIGRAADGVWLYIGTPFGAGWVNAAFVITRDYFGNAPLLTAAQTGAVLDAGAITRTAVNVRSGPNIGFDSIGQLPTGASVVIVGQSRDRAWWYVESAVGRGWVAKSVIKITGTVSGVPVVQ